MLRHRLGRGAVIALIIICSSRTAAADLWNDLAIGLALFDLEADVSEQHDVAAEHPEVVRRLSSLAERMREQLGDSAKGMTGADRRPPGQL